MVDYHGQKCQVKAVYTDQTLKLIHLGSIIALADAIKNDGALAIDCLVVINGLTKSLQLNGKQATVVQRIKIEDASEEVYEVQVETGERKYLKKINLIGGSTNGALTSLNISGNRINRNGVDGQAIVSACASKGVALRMD